MALPRTPAEFRKATAGCETSSADLADLPLRHAPRVPVRARRWEPRHNLAPCDAASVALAEALDTVLLAADARLSRASGVRRTVEVLT